MKILAVLGRQPKISLAELEIQFGQVKKLGSELAMFETTKLPEINKLGGVMKLAELIGNSPYEYLNGLPEGKLTLGISDYRKEARVKIVQMEAMKLKRMLMKQGRKLRILENKTTVLSTAALHHNQIGEKPLRVELIRTQDGWWRTIGVQNISAYAKRDQARPARDAKVGMLPPKLAQILINLCGDLPKNARILDPFCGTGVVLQEAALMGYRPYGTDLNPKMVEYSRRNLLWLTKNDSHDIIEGDATIFRWKPPIDAVAAEIYLGPPMSLPPAEIKLKQVKQECGQILIGFLKNISKQLKPETPLALAIPAWLRPNGNYERLNWLDEVEKLGYNVVRFNNLDQKDLLYHREGQVVAREIIVLRKKLCQR